MRLTQFLLLFSFAFLILSSDSFSQTLLQKRISVYSRNKSLLDVLELVENRSGVSFSYASNVVDTDRSVTLSAKNASIEEILSSLFTGSSVGFSEISNQIILYRKKDGIVATVAGYSVQNVSITEERDEIPRSDLSAKSNEIVFDTVAIFDTVKVFDTLTVTVSDTVRTVIQDTLFVEQRLAKSPASSKKLFSRHTGTISVFGGLCFPYVNYTETIASDSVWQQLQKKHSAKVGRAFSLEYIHNYGRFSVSAGWGYMSWTESFSIDSVVLEPRSVYVGKTQTVHWQVYDVDTVYLGSGEEIVLQDSVPVVEEHDRYETSRRNGDLTDITIYYVTLPFSASYSFAQSPRFICSAGVLMQPTFAISSKGSMYSSSAGESVSYNSGTVAMHSLGLGVQSTIKYAVWDNLWISASVRYTNGFLLKKNDAPIQQHAGVLQLLAGIGVLVN